MKIKFIKKHLKNNIDDVIEVTDARGNYLSRIKVAVNTDEKATVSKPKAVKPKAKKEKKVVEQILENK